MVDQLKKTPLFYRFLPGNLTDVTTLQTTILELESMGVKHSFTLLDAGYFSESNMNDLYKRKILYSQKFRDEDFILFKYQPLSFGWLCRYYSVIKHLAF